MRTKTAVAIILLALSGVFAFCMLVGLAGYRLYQKFNRVPVPHELQEARVVVGQEFLKRDVFARTSFLESVKRIGRINDVAVGEFDSHPGLDVVVAGRDGAIVFDRSSVIQSRTIFQFRATSIKVGPFSTERPEDLLGDVEVVDLEGDGICEYLARGGLDGAAVFDHWGKPLWTYGKYSKDKFLIRDLTVGDLDGDGIDEFVVSWNGIEVFDKSGRKKAQMPEEFGDMQIEVVDTDGDGKNEILSVEGSLKIRDSSGRVIRQVPVPVYFGKFSLCNMPGHKQLVILGMQDGSVWLIDFGGETVAQFNAPLSKFDDTVERLPNGEEIRGTSVYKSKGVWIKLASDRPEYLAVITEFAAVDRSVLDVFTATGELVYQEVLPEECLSLAPLPPVEPSAAPELLVAGSRTVWRYRAGK